MTPAEELTAAADKLDALVAGATEGPWTTYRELDGIFAGQWTVVRAAGLRVASVGQVRRHHSQAAEGNIAYIAAMNPLVGKALAEWLRKAARAASEQMLGWDAEAVVLARSINGSAS